MSYFAVARGHRPGVYLTWEQANAQVNGFSNACHQKFSTRVKAEAFIEKNRDVGVEGIQSRSHQTSGQGRVVMPDVRATSSGPVPPPRIDPIPVYYAVAKGRVPGVYSTYEEVEVQVTGMYSARHKKFYTREEAEQYIEDYRKLRAVDPNDPHPKNPSTLVAFCDGSAINNGKWNCRAGWACVFPHNSEWNRSGVLVGTMVTGGMPTNNRAEYRSVLEAIDRANQEDPSKTRPLNVFSDSMLLVDSMIEHVSKWREQGWVKPNGEPVRNQDFLKWILQEQGSRKIIWKHVKAHTNGTDWWTKWNRKADAMAREQTRDRSFRSTSNDASGRKRSREQIGIRGERERPGTGAGRLSFEAYRDHTTSARIPLASK